MRASAPLACAGAWPSPYVAASTKTWRAAGPTWNCSSGALCTRCPARTSASCSACAKPQVLPPSLATKISMSACVRALLFVRCGRSWRARHQISTPETQNSGTLAPTRPSTTAQNHHAPSPACSISARSYSRCAVVAGCVASGSPEVRSIQVAPLRVVSFQVSSGSEASGKLSARRSLSVTCRSSAMSAAARSPWPVTADATSGSGAASSDTSPSVVELM